MKKTALVFLSLIMLFSFACCGAKTETDVTTTRPVKKAQVSLYEGEMLVIGTVKEVNGNVLTIADDNGGLWSFDFSENVKVVEGGYYIPNLTADYFSGKKVKAIVDKVTQETYPVGLMGERIIEVL